MTPVHHTQSISESFAALGVTPSGLNREEAATRLKKHGTNSLPPKRSDGIFKIFFRQLKNPLTVLLFISSGLAYWMGDRIDAYMILAVILTDVSVGFFQEYKATKSIASMLDFFIPQAIVLRNGERMTLDSRELVPGDIVLMSSGGKIPADLRLIQAYDFAVDESLLTGESVPVEKITAPLSDRDLPIADQTNMLFSGTVVVRGNGRGLVVATGKETVLGTIAQETQMAALQESPLTVEFEKFSRKIGWVVAIGALLVFVLGFVQGETFRDIFKNVVAVSVAAIPEGLPLVVTAALAVTIQRMAKNKSIIRQLPAAETLGSCTVICTDKTGTLTKNEMTVKKLYAGETSYNVTGDGYSAEGIITLEGKTPVETLPDHLKKLLTIGLLCNDSGIRVVEKNVEVHGDPTEVAIILAAYKGGLLKENERAVYPKISVLPFESDRGFMATLHKTRDGQIIFVKGAPEKVARICGKEGDRILKQAEELASLGLRVLAFAQKHVIGHEKVHDRDVQKDYAFVGLAAMIDPPRREVPAAVRLCKEAGIRVMMITGDHAKTSGAIAQALGMTDNPNHVLTGYEMSKMSDDELSSAITTINVYARISPDQKLRIVELLKKQGEIVAVTGDGVNDAPALQVGHIGVAMGKRGTDVAKEVADMVILDDNFATIVKAIEEARILFANIQKATIFLLPTGFAAILTVLATQILGMPAPFTAIQLLWINLVTSGLQDVALVFEPGEKGILRRKPRKQSAGIMNRLMTERSILVAVTIAIGVLVVFLWAIRIGETVESARSIATTTMVIFQFFQLWNSRSESRSIFKIPLFNNPMLFLTMVLAIVAQALAIYWTPLRTLLETTPLSSQTLMWCIVIASSVLFIVEADKYIRKTQNRAR